VAALPEKAIQAWDDKEGPIVLTTVDASGIPNAIYATCVSRFSEDTLVVANNFFSKTLANIQSGSKGSILFITRDGTSYQVKGSIEHHESGPIYDDMKTWNPEKLPGHAAAALKVEEVYSGAERLA
jgi:uncharacterized protein